MLDEGRKHDQIRRHDSDFDKTTNELLGRVCSSECERSDTRVQAARDERGALHSIVRVDYVLKGHRR
jgi:hypothetical protein